jgi:hypothetical protein
VPYKRVLAFLAHGLLIPGYWSGVAFLCSLIIESVKSTRGRQATLDDFASEILLNGLNCSSLSDSPRARLVSLARFVCVISWVIS